MGTAKLKEMPEFAKAKQTQIRLTVILMFIGPCIIVIVDE